MLSAAAVPETVVHNTACLLRRVLTCPAVQQSSSVFHIVISLQCMPTLVPPQPCSLDDACNTAHMYVYSTCECLRPCSLDDDDDELEGIWQAALEGAQQSKRPDAVRSADLSALVRKRLGF